MVLSTSLTQSRISETNAQQNCSNHINAHYASVSLNKAADSMLLLLLLQL